MTWPNSRAYSRLNWDALRTQTASSPADQSARGYLTGTLDSTAVLDLKTDLCAGFDRFSRANRAANRPVFDLLREFAAKMGATPAQRALA